MKPLIFALALCTGTSLAAQNVGITEHTIPAPHHGKNMEMAVIFPTSDGVPTPFAENAVFYGTPLVTDTEPTEGHYPLIVMSHGWGGNYKRMTWLGAGLAEKGAIVVAVNHPNSTTFDMSFEIAFNHWTRAQDLSVAMDYVLQDPNIAPHIDTSRIYAAGFSYGGWTALSLGGAKGSRDGFFDYCDAAGKGSQFCAEIAAKGLDIKDIDQDRFEASYKDPRVQRVAAIDPGLTWGMDNSDVKDLTAPLLLIGLGDGPDRLHATNTSAEGSGFEALVPDADIQIISPAMHFSALGLCKPAGEAILIEEKDDPVCTDPTGTDRAAVLAQMVDALAHHFELE